MKNLICLILTLALLLAACGGCSKPAESGDLSTGGGSESESEENSSSASSESAGKSDNIYYPENQYVMDVEHFVNRENDEYVKYIYGIVRCYNYPLNWENYSGFNSPSEISAYGLYNTFLFAASYSDSYSLFENGFKVPVDDIFDVLDKYYVDYNFRFDDPNFTYNLIFSDDNKYVYTGLDYVMMYPWGNYSIEEVVDNGNGTVTVTIIEKEVETTDLDMHFLDTPIAEATMVLEPGENHCYVVSFNFQTY